MKLAMASPEFDSPAVSSVGSFMLSDYELELERYSTDSALLCNTYKKLGYRMRKALRDTLNENSAKFTWNTIFRHRRVPLVHQSSPPESSVEDSWTSDLAEMITEFENGSCIVRR